MVRSKQTSRKSAGPAPQRKKITDKNKRKDQAEQVPLDSDPRAPVAKKAAEMSEESQAEEAPEEKSSSKQEILNDEEKNTAEPASP